MTAAGDVPPRADKALADGPPTIRSWVPAELPAGATPARVRVVTRIVVDENGDIASARVLRAPDPRLGEAALAAVKKWRFAPAINDGKPAAMCLDVPFEFASGKPARAGLLPRVDLLPTVPEKTKASLKEAPLGDYPASMKSRALPGSVWFECVAQPDGRGRNLRILAASHVEFVVPALESFVRWEFKPAMQGDLPVEAEIRGEVTYGDPVFNRTESLAANGISALDGSVPDDQPHLRAASDPVWPYESLLKHEAGSASVEFGVDARGSVQDVRVREATSPAFGLALAAAVERWVFDAARRDGRGIEVKLLKRADFNLPDPANEEDPLGRVVALMQKGEIRGGGLDDALAPVYRPSPQYPEALRGAGLRGEATIEFVVDREGRVRLPRIVSATRDEFGWSAATAVAQWVFKAPRRKGEPADVQVRAPFSFSPP
ncbi:MAG TPA: TonB family protein [Opitutaceae bacterium]|nr:TonB family protein [Opitutaceae bacterium]